MSKQTLDIFYYTSAFFTFFFFLHSFQHMAQCKLCICKSQTKIFSPTLPLHSHIAGPPTELLHLQKVISTFHVCRQIIWFLCCLYRTWQSFQKFRLPCLLAAGCHVPWLHGLRRVFTGLCVFATWPAQESCTTGGWAGLSTRHWATALLMGDTGGEKGSYLGFIPPRGLICVFLKEKQMEESERGQAKNERESQPNNSKKNYCKPWSTFWVLDKIGQCLHTT